MDSVQRHADRCQPLWVTQCDESGEEAREDPWSESPEATGQPRLCCGWLCTPGQALSGGRAGVRGWGGGTVGAVWPPPYGACQRAERVWRGLSLARD